MSLRDMKDFTHLHLHTTYSMLDGAIRIKELMEQVKALGMSSVAITDHGNMFGAVEFYNEAKKQGVKPILGSEFYVSPNRKEESELTRIPDGNAYHLILLAKNETGYKNLIKLSSKSYTEGFYKKARIDYDLLDKYNDGLVCLTACLAGEVNRKILEGKVPESFQLAGKLHEIFRKEDFYLEIQNHGIPEQETVAKEVYDFSQRTGIPLILTNDSHFLRKDDQEAQDILLRIGMQRKISDPLDFGFNSEFYVKSPDEMWRLFPELPQAFHNTMEVSNKCNLDLTFGNYLLPKYEVPEGYDTDTYMEELVWKGIRERYPSVTPEVKERVDYEMHTIKKMQFSGYFLIVQDYINYAKQTGIPVGPGRGSAAGSIVAYALGITNVEPLQHKLLFERFLNPDRKDMPDIDTDFCVEKREEVINYIRRKYGEDKVGQIITFNSLAAKAALKDVARVLELGFTDANKLTKSFPQKLGMSIAEALETSSDLKEESEKTDQHRKIFQIAERLEGNYRQPGRHAAGVVISPFPLEDVVPLSTVAEKDKSGRSIVTQYDKNHLESIGLIKMDILGLKNLTTIDYAVKLIEKRRGIRIDLDTIPLDDGPTFALLKRANTLGIFQLESYGITDLVAKAQVSKFEEIVALIALYRPGPMGSGMLDSYLKRKSGQEKVTYPHPSVESALEETYGVAVYQEQVMSISRILGGFTVGESDALRKAMAKKKLDKIEEMKVHFIEGAVERGMPQKKAEELYDILAEFGGYGFNKSHSVAYAIITYQTAYLKANYTIEYMAALLAAEHSKTTDIVKYINNAKEMGIAILNPDVTESDVSFSVTGEKEIRFGLSAIKGVGVGAAESLIKQREEMGGIKDLVGFAKGLETKVINKKVLEALIQAGALDSFGYTRKCLFESVDQILNFAQKEAAREREGQFSLFGAEIEEASLALPEDAEEWETDEKLKKEKEMTGLYLSGHPLDKFRANLESLSATNIENLDRVRSGTKVELAGVIGSKTIKLTKKNEEFVNFKLEDRTGEIECIAFPRAYQEFKEMIQEDQAVFLQGELDKIEVGDAERRGQIKVNRMEILNESSILDKMEKALHILIDASKHDGSEIIPRLYSLLASYRGKSAVYFHIVNDGPDKKVIRAHESYGIQPEPELCARITELLGEGSVYRSFGTEMMPFQTAEVS